MSDSISIREHIFQNIKTTLQGIKTTTIGYNYNVDSSNVLIIHGKRDDSAYVEPIIYIYPVSERVNLDAGEKGYDYNEMIVDIEAWIRSEKENMNTNINKMLADLIIALGTDHTRGNYAIDTIFLGNDVFLAADLTSTKCAIVLSAQIDYQNLYGNPYEQ